MADVAVALLVGDVVHEQSGIDVDLVGREAAAVRDPHSREHVVDELRPAQRTEIGDGLAGLVEDLLTVLGYA